MKSQVSSKKTDPLSIRKNLLWNSVGCLIYQGCLWLITVIVVIISGYDDSGILAYAMALGNMYFSMAIYNMRVYQVSDVSGENTQQNYVAFRLITMAGAAIVMICYLFATTSSPALLIATLCMLVFKADEALSSVYYGAEQRGDRMDYIGKSQMARGAIIVVMFTLILKLTQNLDLAIIGMSVCCIAVTLLYDRTRAALLFSVAPSIDAKKVVFLLRKCLPAAITLVCYGAVVSIARQIYEGLYGQEMLGIYAAIATPTVLVQVLSSYLYSPFIGTIAHAWNRRDRRTLLTTLGKIIGGIIAIVGLLCVLAAFFGNDLLVLLYGDSIAPYTHLLIPTLFAVTASATMALFLDVMVSFRKLLIALVGNTVALGVVVFGSRSFMLGYGMNGINLVIICGFACGIIIGLALFAIGRLNQKDEGK